jgi:predicted nucleic acid-binding protein
VRATPSSATWGRSRVPQTCQPRSIRRCTALAVLADSGLLIAAINRGDRHHAWATRQIVAARRQHAKIAVPDLVVGEAFTKLRYDRRVSPRKDASIALTVFRLVDDSTEVFEVRSAGQGAYQKARDVLAQYVDQSFSFVDAIVFTVVDADPAIRQILTVDGRDFAIYRFAHSVEVVVP